MSGGGARYPPPSNHESNDWIKKIEESKKEHTKLKAEVKKKMDIRTLKVLEQCKAHGGPISSSDQIK